MNPSACANFFCAVALFAFAATASAENFLVYFGTYTNALSRGIYVSRLGAATGILSAPTLAAEAPSPCFINLSPDGKFLYAANSVKTFNGENAGAVSAFAIDKTSGKLTLLNQKSSGGIGPCHVSVDATGKTLFVANYGDGSIKSFSILTNGAIGEDGDRAERVGHSVNTNRQNSAHAHFICADPSNKFALVCDLGTDEIISYPFDATNAHLHVAGFEVGSVPSGAGARHLVFGRDGKTFYLVNEMGCSISRFMLDEKGRIYPFETIPALPPGVAVQTSFTAAEILVSPNKKFLYATVRGHDSVSVFATDAHSGKLTFVQNISAGGKVPRGLGIDPTGRWLITANQKSENAVEFAIDAVTGKLSPTGQELKMGSPVDVKFVKGD
ncbi:MAG TPA: lactonase family protein [Verrucomicrobiae bacterium]